MIAITNREGLWANLHGIIGLWCSIQIESLVITYKLVVLVISAVQKYNMNWWGNVIKKTSVQGHTILSSATQVDL